MNRFTICLIVGYSFSVPTFAQPPKPPPLPPIAPAQARLDQTLGGSDGACYALTADEKSGVLIAAGESGSLLAWPRSAWMGVRVGEKAPDAVPGHEGVVTALAGGNTEWLASAGADRKIRIWAMPGPVLKHTLDTGQLVRALAFSPDGKRLAAGDDSNAIHLFEPSSAKPLGKLVGHSDWVLTLAFSPDGTRLVSGGHDGQLLLWDVAGSKKIQELQSRPPTPPNSPPPAVSITSLAYRADGQLLAVGNSAGQIHFVNPIDGKIARPTALPHSSSVMGLAFHPSGTVLASCSKDRTVKLWDVNSGNQLVSLEGHTAWVQGVAFLEKGTRLASVGADQTVRIWDLTPKK